MNSANFQLPEEGDVFHKVEYIELQAEEARVLVEQYNKEGKAAAPAGNKRFCNNERDRYTSSRWEPLGWFVWPGCWNMFLGMIRKPYVSV